MPWHDGWHMGGMWLWWVLALVTIGVILWLVVAQARRTAGSPPDAPDEGRRRAEEILKERYARGEIDRAEYRERMDELHR